MDVEAQPQGPPYYPGAGIQPSGPSEDFFRFRIDGSDILEDMSHQLRGELFNEKANKWEKKFDRWINDEGINKVLHVVYACGINKNTFLGNLTKDQIDYKCNLLKKNVASLFFKKYKDFDIKKEMRNLLIDTIVNQIHSGLSRSEGGKEAHQLSTASQRIETYSHQEKGGASSFNPFSIFKKR